MAVDKTLVRDYAIRLGDDALVLGHRLSEWCGNGPFLEEDLALANVALDYLGRARMFFNYAAELAADGSTEDTYAYTRDCREFRNLLINELPRGDFAFTMARQYLVDEFSMAFMQALCDSNDPVLAGIAEKARKEARYHLRRSTDWMLRLGDGTPESHDRLQQAMNDIWGYTQEMFEVDALEERLIKAGIAVDAAALRQAWSSRVSETLAQATIEQPRDDWSVSGGRRGVHTESLGHMLAELQFLQRAYPAQQW